MIGEEVHSIGRYFVLINYLLSTTAREVEINRDFGELATPTYPFLFTSSNDYTWRISVQFGHVMLISFQEFLLQRLENGLCAARFTVSYSFY